MPPDHFTRTLLPAVAFAALFAATAAAVWWVEPPPWPIAVASLLLALALAVLAAIDARTYRLPDALTLPLLIAGLACVWALDLAPLWWRSLSAVIGWCLLAGIAALYQRARGRAGLGLGDAKLLSAGAAWTGAEGIPTVLLVGAGAALLLVALAWLARRPIDGRTRLPFGPFLALGIWFVWLLGPI